MTDSTRSNDHSAEDRPGGLKLIACPAVLGELAQQVKDDVKELVDLFGDTGALILDCGLGVPDEAKPENMLALREAADEYGVL